MKSKKFIAILASFLLSCTAAYLIGQNVVLPLTQKDDTSVKESNDGLRSGTIEFSFTDSFDTLSFTGKRVVDTSSIPWGNTIAKIEDDTVGTSIMMVQGTGLSVDYHVVGNESVHFFSNIHPWVSESSDGMSLYLRVYENDNEIPSIRRTYIIQPEDEQIEIELPLNEFEGQDIRLSFFADNGGNGDSSGDWLVLSEFNIVSYNMEIPVQSYNDDYWISAHYFADLWPANMWDSEFKNIDDDLLQIKSDGFNSIILLIPWRQFQPNIGKTNTYNKAVLEKLDLIMKKADEYGLGVILRIGYTWDYYQNRGNDEIIERYENIVNDAQTMNAWLEYVERIYALASMHDSLWGGFICWEDFWNMTTKMKTISGNNEDSLKYAQSIGFGKYVADNYEIPDIRKLYADDKIYSEEDIYIPAEDKQAFKLFYDYYDDFLNRLLSFSQTAFPNLSMEVRVDDDLIVNEKNETLYYTHENTYLCEGSDYTTIMYGIPIGFDNNGQKVTWEEANEKTGNILEKVKRGAGDKKIFIDQFLYYDNTQAYSHNVQLIDDQIDDYLRNSESILKKYTRGYGVWVYKDYYVDTIANGCFAEGLDGWISVGDAAVKKIDGNNKCLLVDGAEIKQNTEGKATDREGVITCSFNGTLIESAFTLNISLNGEKKELVIDADGTYSVEFEGSDWGDLTLSVVGEGFIDDVKLYNFCQKGLLYDVNGTKSDLVSEIKDLNDRLLH